MYNYDFKNKKIVLELVNVLVSIDDKDLTSWDSSHIRLYDNINGDVSNKKLFSP